MSEQILVGSTGLVGQNLLSQHAFDKSVHSTNVAEAFDRDCGLVVYAGVPGTKYLANKDPQNDLATVKAARENLRRIDADKVVLISTVDVYGDSRGKTERDAPGGPGLTAYGENRLQLERWVREDFPDVAIVRLPAIYGKGLKKNFVYDMIHPAPAMLEAEIYEELAKSSPLVRGGYADEGNGYYKRADFSTALSTDELDIWFSKQRFNSLKYTDSRSKYQFYDLTCLWSDIRWAINSSIELLNVATPPISAGDAYKMVFNTKWANYLDQQPVDYDMRTIYVGQFKQESGYLCSSEEELERLKEFVLANRAKSMIKQY